MLAQRIVTAAVLLAILVPAIFLAPAWVWGLVSLAAVVAAGLEWGRLLGRPSFAPTLAIALGLLGLAYLGGRGAGLQAPTLAALLAALALAFWVALAPLGLARVRPIDGGWLVALVTLSAGWLALYELRMSGAAMLVSCMAVVWFADVGAYAAGRTLGRRKLAPRISPGKSWEGVAGGAAAVLVAAALTALLAPEAPVLPSVLGQRLAWPLAALVLLAIVALSVVGDLYESLLKRRAGVKDSGGLLPGHGGVLDRVDALIPTMPACLLALELLR